MGAPALHPKSAWRAPRRGWERQLDRRFNPLFYGRRLDPAAYHRWLRANAVAYVALPDVPMDSAGRAEAALVRGGLPYLQPLWHDEHWWLFRVRDALPLASGAATGIDLDQTTLRLTATRPGAILVRVRWTPFWRVVSGSGCVTRSGPWTLVRARHSGTLVIGARFAMQRLFEEPPACPP